MANRTFKLSPDNHGSISIGANWTKQAIEGTITEQAISAYIAGSSTETDYAVTTEAPNEASWNGNWSGQIDISTGVNKVYCRVGLEAYTSGGASVDGPYWSNEGSFEIEIAQAYSLTWTGLSWTNNPTTDYLAIVFEWNNGENHGAITIAVDSSTTYVVSPWTAAAVHDATCTETAQFAETVSTTQTATETQTDGVQFAETVSITVTKTVTATETAQFGETVNVGKVMDVTCTDGMALAERVQTGVDEFVCEVGPSQTDYATLNLWAAAHVGNYTGTGSILVFSHDGENGTIDDQDTVTGDSSGATGTVLHVTTTHILVQVSTGEFISGERMEEDGDPDNNYVTLSNAGARARPVATLGTASSASDDTDATISNSWTTDTENYYIIRPQAGKGHSGAWPTGATVWRKEVNNIGIRTGTTGGAAVFGYIIGVCVQESGTGDYKACIRVSDAVVKPILDDCITRGNASIGIQSYGIYDGRLRNCLIYDFVNTNSMGLQLPLIAFNCTIHNCTNGVKTGASTRIKNCLIQSCTNDIDPSSSTGFVECAYNVGEDTTNWTLVTEHASPTTHVTGTTDDTVAGRLVDSDVDFVSIGVQVGCIVKNTTDTTFTYVTGVYDGYCEVYNDIFVNGEGYAVYTNMVGSALFTDESGDDFSLQSGDTAAKNKGLDLSLDANLAVVDDILGTSRSAPFDVGTFEFVGGDTFPATCAETIQFAETVSISLTATATATEQVNFAETISATAIFAATITETTQFAETLNAALTATATMGDGIQFAETVSALGEFGLTASEQIDFAETLNNALDILLTATDGVQFDEAVSAQKEGILCTCTEGIQFGDTVYITGIFAETVVDGIQFADSPAGQLDAIITVDEGIQLAEAVSIQKVGLPCTATEGIQFADAVSMQVVWSLTVVDGFSFGDTPTGTWETTITHTDGIQFGEAVSTTKFTGYPATITEGIQFSDAVSIALVATATVTDGIQFADVVAGTYIGEVVVSDGLAFGESISALGTFQETIADGIAFAETVSAARVPLLLPSGEAVAWIRALRPSMTIELWEP